jgi:hypothetical protein
VGSIIFEEDPLTETSAKSDRLFQMLESGTQLKRSECTISIEATALTARYSTGGRDMPTKECSGDVG